MGIFKVLVVNRGSPPPMKIFFLCITEHAELGHVKQIKKMKKVCPDPPPCWENSQFFFSNEPFPNKYIDILQIVSET